MSNKNYPSGPLNNNASPNRPNQCSRPGLHQGNLHSLNNMYASIVYSMCQQNISYALSEQPVTLAHPPTVSHPSANPLNDIHKNHKCIVPSPLANKNKDPKVNEGSK